MGILSFLSNAGKKLFGKGDDAQELKKEISAGLDSADVENFNVSVDNGKVVLSGDAPQEVLEKAALIAGNVEGVSTVEVAGVRDDSEAHYYTIVKGDSLSKIAKKIYGDPMKYKIIFEANREVIKDPDLIYPGQKIRIP